MPVLDLGEFPNAVVDVFIELPQTDAGTRCAGICAASMALADAGLNMKDLVASVAVGRVDDKIVVDLNYDEEAYEDGTVADIPVAIAPTTRNLENCCFFERGDIVLFELAFMVVPLRNRARRGFDRYAWSSFDSIPNLRKDSRSV